LALAKDRSLAYAALLQALGLQTPRELEDLVISSVYAGLIRATLDPANQAVRVSSVAALRDVAPGAVPGFLESLQVWAARCDETLAELDARVAEVREEASRRAEEKTNWDARLARLVEEEQKSGGRAELGSSTGAPGGSSAPPASRGQRYGKRGSGHMDPTGASGQLDDEAMDLDEEDDSPDGKKRSSRRRLQG
jgi:COP9 signalosome complex subunit 7